jgi:hypothetical protein
MALTAGIGLVVMRPLLDARIGSSAPETANRSAADRGAYSRQSGAIHLFQHEPHSNRVSEKANPHTRGNAGYTLVRYALRYK